MKKLIRLLVIIVIGIIGYVFLHVQKAVAPIASMQYTVKAVARTNAPGEDIYVYGKSGKQIFALLSQDPQYFYTLVDNFLILDIGTSASQRTVDVYDIPSQEKIFESSYYPSDKQSLYVTGTTLQYYYKIRSEFQGGIKPALAPTCFPPNNGYIETRIFDLVTKKITETGIFTCAYFE